MATTHQSEIIMAASLRSGHASPPPDAMLKKLLHPRSPNLPDPDAPWFSEAAGELAPVRRMLVILRPQAPFLQWLRRTIPDVSVSLKELHDDATAYLVPTEEWDIDAARDYIDAHHGRFFAQELEQWILDRDRWPEARTLALFRLWFKVEILDMVIDIGGRT